MQRRTAISLGLGALCVACAAGAFNGAPRTAPPIATKPLAEGDESRIAGIVRNANTGEPVATALIVLQCGCMEGQRETQTNAQGVYVFHDLPPGNYTVQALVGSADASRSLALGTAVKARVDFALDDHPAVVT